MWPPTGLIPWFSKTEGNTYATLLHHHVLFGEVLRSAQEVARRISGAVAGEAHASKSNIPSTHRNPYLSHYIIWHLPLVFLSPTSPLPFYLPCLSQYPLSLSLAFFCLLVCPCAFYVLASLLAKNLLIWIHLKCSTWIIFDPYALVLKPQLA